MAVEWCAECVVKLLEFKSLIFGERFGREKIDGSSGGIVEQGLNNGNVVAKSLAAGGRGDDDYVFTIQRMLDGGGLMSVELLNAAFAKRLGHTVVESFGKFGIAGDPGRLVTNSTDRRFIVLHGFEKPRGKRLHDGGCALHS